VDLVGVSIGERVTAELVFDSHGGDRNLLGFWESYCGRRTDDEVV
jgi:hypothetical protein